ncbi:MAG: hypothetical protein OEY55_03345 [Acidimicrobiia bacterium]|nr:hypothetical protein [Acidimicrobiia bacterium]
MDEPKTSTETLDDTPVGPDMTDSDLAAEKPDASSVDVQTGGAETGGSSVELAIETLAGLDAADAPDLADEVATRLRAQLSDN